MLGFTKLITSLSWIATLITSAFFTSQAILGKSPWVMLLIPAGLLIFTVVMTTLITALSHRSVSRS